MSTLGPGDIQVVTIGEVFLALRAPAYGRLEWARSLDCMPAGSEANVAVGLARLGVGSAWIGKMPRSPMARNLVNSVRSLGVDVSRVIWSDKGRLGLSFVELGVAPRASYMLYDRENSAASTMAPEEVDWGFVRGARHIHLTGITSALSESCHQTVVKAVSEAKKAGLTVSLDVNYRSALWSPDAARSKLTQLAPNVDVLFAGLADARSLFRLNGGEEEIARLLKERFGSRIVALTLHERGCLVCADTIHRSPAYPTTVLNRFGAGDAFAAGFLFGFLRDDLTMALDFGTAMASLKLAQPDSNFPLMTREDIDRALRREGPLQRSFESQNRSDDVIR